MRLLLDTHIWLWTLREPHKLTSLVHQAMFAPENDLYLSPISIWEVTVLLEKRKIEMHEDFGVWFARTAQDLELQEANLHWQIAHNMRFILPDHRDPADRFLVATAMAFDLVLVTADSKLLAVPGLKVLANV
jgi:PIN domain nuclease of toxin-antitoxin system